MRVIQTSPPRTGRGFINLAGNVVVRWHDGTVEAVRPRDVILMEHISKQPK